MEFVRNVCSILASLIGIYSLIIVVRIIFSWIDNIQRANAWRNGYNSYNGYNQQSSTLSSISNFLGKLVDPYLNLFKGITSLRRSHLDLTPLVAIIVLNLFQSIFNIVAISGRITIGVILALIVNLAWGSFFSYILFFLIVLLIIRYFIGRSNSYKAQNWLNAIDPIINSPVQKVYKIFFAKKGESDDQKVVLVSLVFYIIIFVICKFAVSWLVSFLASL
jgi:YggT family protein